MESGINGIIVLLCVSQLLGWGQCGAVSILHGRSPVRDYRHAGHLGSLRLELMFISRVIMDVWAQAWRVKFSLRYRRKKTSSSLGGN